jgi:hypothetical protein
VPHTGLTPATGNPVCYFWSGESIRSRGVGGVVLQGTVDIPALPPRLQADWSRDIAQHVGLEPGDVDSLSLARARMRWPNYTLCTDALAQWMRGFGLQDVLVTSEVALMACRGARYHHDAVQYGAAAFCNLFLSEDKGFDLHFPMAGVRIPLRRGTAVVFDTGQPHAVIPRTSRGFDAGDFPDGQDCDVVFLTWELAISHPSVSQALRIAFDVDPATASVSREPGIRVGGKSVGVCPRLGGWTLAP